jgi:hypothetical protein
MTGYLQRLPGLYDPVCHEQNQGAEHSFWQPFLWKTHRLKMAK